MNVEELSMIGPNVDLETVEPMNKKRLITFVNHFIVNTTLFLNKLSKSCEYGLMSLENKIQKLETSIVILESKLNSVPGLEDSDSDSLGLSKAAEKQEIIKEKIAENEVETIDKSESNKVREPLDPGLLKYVKMLQFGVPAPAVKLKMEQENVDSNFHDLVLNYNK